MRIWLISYSEWCYVGFFSSVGLPSEFSKRLVFEGWFKPCYVLWFVSFIINGKS